MYKTSIIIILILLASCTISNETIETIPEFEAEPEIEYSKAANFTCFTDKFEFGMTNLDENRVIYNKELKFMINGSEVFCNGMPEAINPYQNVECNITKESPENHTVEVFLEKTIMQFNTSFSCSIFYEEGIEFTPSDFTSEPEPEPNLTEFISWAEERHIALVGIKKDANEIYYEGLNSDDIIDLEEVPYWWWAERGLRKVTDSVLEVMKDKTIYFSIKYGRGYALATGWIEGTTAGFILEQTITDYQTVHELGHIVDDNVPPNTKRERDKIFKAVDESKYNPDAAEIPEGFINIYSSANDQENFAEHFAYYVLYPDEFRDRMGNNTLLAEKYDFFKSHIFEGKEY